VSAAAELIWIHTDRLGSVVALTDSGGRFKERLAYDAWGKRRALDGTSTPASLDASAGHRGFTGHEMLDNLDLVHMNGRVYDPLLSRFISADPIIQDPESSQSYNRYSYVWNNPTNLTDPTGFEASGTSKDAIKSYCSGSAMAFCSSRVEKAILEQQSQMMASWFNGASSILEGNGASQSVLGDDIIRGGSSNSREVTQTGKASTQGATPGGGDDAEDAQPRITGTPDATLPTVTVSYRRPLQQKAQKAVSALTGWMPDVVREQAILRAGQASGKLTSEFEINAFKRWARGGGNLHLTPPEFARILKEGQLSDKGTPAEWLGLKVTAKTIDLYKSQEFDYAIGQATVYFYRDVPIGFSDTHNFDNGRRGKLAEFATRTTNTMRPSTAKDYDIVYP
jgi:RHS repeat-associated protein